MDDTSLSLLDRIRETSDAPSWDRLVALYSPLLKRWVLWYDVQDSDADDIVQEVLAAVVSDVPKFHRQVVDGQKPKRIAQDLNMTVSGAYTAKSRVLSALRRECQGLIDEF